MAQSSSHRGGALGSRTRRCRSWRFTQVAGHQHLPGECRECWKPCRQRVERDERRCHDCLVALASCPDTRIRRALLEEQPIDTDAVELLADDANPVIAREARTLLAGLGAAPDAEPQTGEALAEISEFDLALEQLGTEPDPDVQSVTDVAGINEHPFEIDEDEKSTLPSGSEPMETGGSDLAEIEPDADDSPNDDTPNGWGF